MGKQLDFASDSDDGDILTINKDYAKRFEHNKSREELHKLKEKYGSEAEDESSSSEEEDDYGDLVTNEIDTGINKVLDVIRNHPDKLLDKNLRFFPEVGAEGTAESRPKDSKDKPVFLKDYHREKLLKGDIEDDEDQVETYHQQQQREKDELLKQIQEHDDHDDGGDFFSKRTEQREVEPAPLPDPEQDAEGFLDAFVSKKAWIPKDVDVDTGEKKLPTYQELVDDGEEDSEGFDDIAEKFESAYNFRYEDPNSKEIMSYARDQNTLRRNKDSARQRKRDKKREQKEREESERKKEVARLKKLKVKEVSQKLETIGKVLGGEDIGIAPEDLDGDWDQDEWDKRMQKLFDEEYYSKPDNDWKPADDAEIVAEVEGDSGAEGPSQPAIPSSVTAAVSKLSKKDLKRKAQEIVDANTDLLLDEAYKPSAAFRYRDVEPESYGLTTEDILMASDKDLNRYAGIKKLASFRDEEIKSKDKKRYSKKKRLREWRKEVFGSEEGADLALWEQLKREEGAEPPAKKARKPKHKRKAH